MTEPAFPVEVLTEVKKHALSEFPKESVGFIGPEGYRPVVNLSTAPEDRFIVSSEVYLDNKDALAFVHSHPEKEAFDRRRFRPGFYPDCPSKSDMECQIATGLTWGITVTDGQTAKDPFWWGDFVLTRRLLGQAFRHGTEDCYTAIRKWFQQKRQIVLPEFPRDADWWEGDEPMYEEGFQKAGFVRLGSNPKPKEGDVGLTRVGGKIAKQVNHGFVWLGDGSIYHHLPGRLSRREAAAGRTTRGVIWLRYEGVEDA